MVGKILMLFIPIFVVVMAAVYIRHVVARRRRHYVTSIKHTRDDLCGFSSISAIAKPVGAFSGRSAAVRPTEIVNAKVPGRLWSRVWSRLLAGLQPSSGQLAACDTREWISLSRSNSNNCGFGHLQLGGSAIGRPVLLSGLGAQTTVTKGGQLALVRGPSGPLMGTIWPGLGGQKMQATRGLGKPQLDGPIGQSASSGQLEVGQSRDEARLGLRAHQEIPPRLTQPGFRRRSRKWTLKKKTDSARAKTKELDNSEVRFDPECV